MRAHNTICEFEELHLSPLEAEDDVKEWFKQNQKGGALQDCLQDLAASNGKFIITLDSSSQQHVAMNFHNLKAESVGLSMSPAELYKISYL